MKNLKVFDVVELNNNKKATVLTVSEKLCLVDIEGEQKKHQLINKNEIKSIIYSKEIYE